jgi:phosphate transport system substrate-binding protein
MQKTKGFLILLALVAVILLGFIAGKVAEPPQAAPTYTPWPTYTPYPTIAPIASPISVQAMQPKLDYPFNTIAQNYPRVDGSTSAKPLQDMIVCYFFGLDCKWEWSPGSQSERYIQFLAYTNQYFIFSEKFLPDTKHHGTHDAYMNLINGETDFILVARLPSTDELNEAKAKGITLDAQPVALDAFVMLAHADNPVSTISLDQIRSIYSGRITEWTQIGGLSLPIHAYQREENSGSQELIKALVMGDTPTIDSPEMIVYTMAGPFNAIEGSATNFEPGDPNGIGYSVYYYTWFIMGPLQDVKILAVEGVRPTSKTIADRTFPLVAEVYAVTRAGESPTSSAVLLRDWLLTLAGQRVVEESGYVPITPPQ